MHFRATFLMGSLGLALAGACGSSEDSAGASDGRGDFGGSGGSSQGPSPGQPGGGTGGFGELPPEVEVHQDFELPQAGEHYVYVANPETDNVAVIDAATLGIHIVEAGDEPTFLQTLAGRDAAIVLNVGSADATILRTTDGVSRATQVGVQPGSNAIAVNPQGTHAVVYFDPAYATRGGRQGSFQDVTVLVLSGEGDRSVPATVGFKPTAVFFQDDGSHAFVVTEDGVSVLDFEAMEAHGGGIARTVPLGQVGIDATLDISVTPDCRHALARQDGGSVLRLVDLATGTIRLLDLATLTTPDGLGDAGPGGLPDAAPSPEGGSGTAEDGGSLPEAEAGADPPALPDAGAADATAPLVFSRFSSHLGSAVVTDLDLAPSGDYALAVVRDASTVLRLPIPEAFEDAASIASYRIANELVGSATFAPDGRRALLYTTVVDTNERITILDLEEGTYRPVQLRKAIRSVTVSPDGQKALVIHRKLPGDPTDPGVDLDTQIDRSYGYSLLELETGFAKLEVTPADLGPFALVPDGSFLFLLFASDTLHEVQRANLSSFFVDRFTLGSPPVSVGAVPATNKVFVGQEHPDGRIAFIDWQTGAVQSVTGFELNSRIRE
jgi:hypothetical protein